ncbi:MAG: hypothetical protein A2X64_05850 [Ignavibacteria bacterium GWF2_33_9]|nr:MAG: hypothetical protein A2X64_05850 [Ignavibacteria bacterium GWF2_33_9]
MNRQVSEKINTFLLVLPWILVLFVFWLYPLIYSGYLSLTEYKTLTDETTFIGLQNFSNLFSDPLFWHALWNTVYFASITVPVTLIIAVLFAEIINQKITKFKGFFQSTYFLPSVTSLVVISLIFTNLYSHSGYINNLLSMMGLPKSEKGFLLDTSTSLNSIILMDIWLSIGYYMVLFLSGMQTISKDLYDNAKLSGASFWQRFRFVTIPGLRSTITFVLLIDLIKSFQVFIEIFVMTKGGPLNSTTSIVYLVFDNAFNKADMMGYASAMAYILFFLLLILSFFQIKLSERK